MAIPKRGARNIVVDGQAYRWYVRRKPSHGQADYFKNMGLAVEHATIPGSVLVAELSEQNSRCWWGYGVSKGVVPADVERYIRTALAKGWQPTQAGKNIPYQKVGCHTKRGRP